MHEHIAQILSFTCVSLSTVDEDGKVITTSAADYTNLEMELKNAFQIPICLANTLTGFVGPQYNSKIFKKTNLVVSFYDSVVKVIQTW